MSTGTYTRYTPLHAQHFLADECGTFLRCFYQGSTQSHVEISARIVFAVSAAIEQHGHKWHSCVLTAPNLEAPQASSTTFSNRMEKVRRDLERMKDRWNGPDSMAPSAEILSDLDNVLGALPEDTATPEVEVEDSGGLTLRWQAEGASSSLSLVFHGNGSALAIKTSLGEPAFAISRRLDVEQGNAIARFLARDDMLAEALVHG
jgi:hypothetical protein